MLKETFFCEVSGLFENTKIVGNDGSWKPVQTGTILTTSVMQLQKHLVMKKHFLFFIFCSAFSVWLGFPRKLFSTLRMNNAVPSPCQFERALRRAELSQFLRPNPKTNCTCSDGKAFEGLGGKNPQP